MVILNCAASADGKLAARDRRQVRISGPGDMARVHRMRSSSDAVLVGIGTVLADDPKLTLKRELAPEGNQPARVVLDPRGRTPVKSAVLGPGGPTYIAVAAREGEGAPSPESLSPLRLAGARILECAPVRAGGGPAAGPAQKPPGGERTEPLPGDERTEPLPGDERTEPLPDGGRTTHNGAAGRPERLLDLSALLARLSKLGIGKLMVEGGATTIWSFIRSGLFDELHVFHGSIIIGGADAPTIADGPGLLETEGFVRLELAGLERLDDGYLVSYRRAR